jgi:hypothetical protein
MSLPEELSLQTLETLLNRVGATEVHGADGGAFLTAISEPFGGVEVGVQRIFTSASVPKIVYAKLAVPPINMDTHMIFGFGASDSAIPHFTLDSVHANGTLAFHLDLTPRAELATHVPYMDYVYGPLSELFAETNKWEGLTKAHISPRQYAMMSPWMLVNRADAETFQKISGPVNQYLERWLTIVENGIPADILESLSDTDLADRDAKQRANLFSPDVDPVWHDVAKIVGDELSEKMRVQLTSNDI